MTGDKNKNSWNSFLKPTSVFTRGIKLSPRYSNDNKDRGSKVLQDPWTGMTNKQIDIEYAKLIAW